MVSRFRMFSLVMIAATIVSGRLEAEDTRTEILLWPDGAPGAIGAEPADQPKLTVYRPATGADATPVTRCGVVVCPGGGYGGLAMDHEGRQIGEWWNSLGVTAFVLTYRHAPRYQHPAPMQDVQRALRIVRARSDEFAIDANRIGVMGFSAGGHLASTAATHFDGGDPAADDMIDRVSCRPDFAVLCYAVISFKEDFTHKGSRRNLLGSEPSAELVESLSNETQVTPETPPTFLFHTTEDKVVPPENSIAFYTALHRAGVPAEMHIYERGRHGVGLAASMPAVSSWPERLRQWLAGRGMLGD